jgi:hypothetical protein
MFPRATVGFAIGSPKTYAVFRQTEKGCATKLGLQIQAPLFNYRAVILQRGSHFHPAHLPEIYYRSKIKES